MLDRRPKSLLSKYVNGMYAIAKVWKVWEHHLKTWNSNQLYSCEHSAEEACQLLWTCNFVSTRMLCYWYHGAKVSLINHICKGLVLFCCPEYRFFILVAHLVAFVNCYTSSSRSLLSLDISWALGCNFHNYKLKKHIILKEFVGTNLLELCLHSEFFNILLFKHINC